MYGFIGFITGFIAGMVINMYLLKGVPGGVMRSNKDMRLKYGAINWAVAIFGLVIGLALSEN